MGIQVIGWIAATVASAAFFVVGPARSQAPKELRTKTGSSVVLANFINPRADCSINPGPVAVPIVSGPPRSGVVQMQVVVSNVPASGNCPARKLASIAIIYTPNKDFVGSDSVQLEVEAGNRKSALSYNISVLGAGQQQQL